MKVKKTYINYILVSILIFLALFDNHFQVLLNIPSLPFAELFMLALVVFSLVYNAIFYRTTNYIFVLIFVTLLISFITGLFKSNGMIMTILGLVWLYKTFLAFYIGTQYKIRTEKYYTLLQYIFYFSLVTGLSTILQLFIDFNPLGFNVRSSPYIGIMDNPNKNAFILLFGLLYVNYYKKKFSVVLSLLFIFSILLTQSRQIVVILILVLTYYFVILKKYYLYASLFLISASAVFIYFKEVFFYRFAEIDRILSTGDYFRLKALKISFTAIGEHPFFGLGPGSFGGGIAHLLQSKYHAEYNLFYHWRHYRNMDLVPNTIDMFWPHMWVEAGLICFLLSIIIYYLIFRKLKNSRFYFAILLFMVVLIMSFFSMSFESTYLAIPVFIILGLNYSRKVLT